MRVLLPMFVLLSSGPLQAQDKVVSSTVAANAHACDLFHIFRQMTGGNFCFSPYSSYQVAALLTAAANGDTQAELAKLAHLDADVAQGLKSVEALHATLADSARKGALALEISNSLWAAASSVYEPAFVQSARSQLGASLEKLPAENSTACAAVVNRWVREKTRGRVSHVVGPGAFANPGQTVLAVNTVHMKGFWAEPFDPRLTKQRPFHTPQQGAVMRPTMMMPKGRFRYGESETFQCLSLPLAGNEASLLILLPRDETMREKIETKITPASWKAVLHDLNFADVNTMMPRFSYSTQLSLKGLWQALGAKHVFEPGLADLKAALKLDGGFVSDVLHESSIEVNEVGAEASAATAVPADPFGEEPAAQQRPVKNFIANRPFVWMLRHDATDLILFMGRYAGD